MNGQKFFLYSKTVWWAIFTFLIAVCPLLLQGLEQGFNEVLIGEIIGLLITTGLTLRSRYLAQGTLYTPHGFPGRSYVRAWKERL